MGRALIGYRIRAKSGDGFVYLSSCGDRPAFPTCFWSKWLSRGVMYKIRPRNTFRHCARNGRAVNIDMNGDPIEISDPKIVAVYLRRNEP